MYIRQFIYYTFLRITSQLKEIVYYSRRPIEANKKLLSISFKDNSDIVIERNAIKTNHV